MQVGETTPSLSLDHPASPNYFLSFLFLMLVLLSLPYSVTVIRSVLEIYTNKQPMFLVFAVTLFGGLLHSLGSLVKGLGYVVDIRGCTAFGIFGLACFSYISIFIAFICICRAVAVAAPLRYRCLMSVSTIKTAITLCLVGVVIHLALTIAPSDLSFQYVVIPIGRVGCIPVLTKKQRVCLSAALILGIFGFDVVLLASYLMLHKMFAKYSTRKHIQALKRVVFKISLSTIVMYIFCFMPTLVLYLLLASELINLKEFEDVEYLYTDAVLAFSTFLYSALLPICLVHSKLLTSGKKQSQVGSFIHKY